MPSRADLQALRDRGWSLVPIRPGSKAPEARNWVERAFTPDDFAPDDNVGVKLGTVSGDLVDVDCDDDLFAKAAFQLLPTTLTHGRPGRPCSHYFFRVTDGAPDTSKSWRSLTGGNLAELRSTGGQTVIPPSTHPSGETLAWVDPTATPLPVTKADLNAALYRALVAATLASVWPSARRHECAGHVAGFLAPYVGTPADVERIVRVAVTLAGDEEPDDRCRYARETAQKFAAGDKTTGAPKLKDLLGDAGRPFVQFVRKLYDENAQLDVLEEMNDLHFVVQLGASVVVGTEPTRPNDAVEFQKFAEFQQKYFNTWIGKKKRGLAWLEWEDRRTYDRMVFAPPGSRVSVGEHDYNLWRGFAVTPLPGDPVPHITRYLDHLYEVICGADDEVYKFLLDLLADCVQTPGDPPGKALVLRGGMGVGKTLALETFGKLFGRHFLVVNHRVQLTGPFNGHLSGRVVLLGDDAVWGGNKEDVGVLKHLTTSRVLPVTRKHLDTVSEPNYLHLFLTTNERWAWPAGNKERRGVVLDVTAHRPRAYFEALVAEINQPLFLSALLAYLQRHPVDRLSLLDGVQNAALREQQDLSVSVEQQWWRQVLEEGYWRGDPWPEFVILDVMYDQFTSDMGSQRGAGVSHRGTKMNLTRRIHEMLPPSARVSTKKIRENLYEGVRGMAPDYVEKVRKVLVLPGLDACRAAYNKYSGMDVTWPAVESAQQTEMEL